MTIHDALPYLTGLLAFFGGMVLKDLHRRIGAVEERVGKHEDGAEALALTVRELTVEVRHLREQLASTKPVCPVGIAE